MISLTRTSNLLKTQHMVRPPTLAKSLGIGFALILTAFILRYIGGEPARIDGFIIAPMVIAALVFGELYMFKPLKDPRSTVFYLTIPASTTEKWLANWISSFLLLPALVLAGCYLANIIAYGVMNFLGTADFRVPRGWDALTAYWHLHPLLFFGAIYFRTAVLFKTFGSLAVLFIVSMFLFFFATVIATPSLLDLNGNINIGEGYSPVPGFVAGLFASEVFHWLLHIIYFSFFWGLSLLRLREVEI